MFLPPFDWFLSRPGSGPVGGGGGPDALLLEGGNYLLLEGGGHLLL